MPKLILLFFLIFIITGVVAQERAVTPEATVVSSPGIPTAQAKSIDGLSRYINAHYRTPQEKVQALYSWLTSNVVYDVYALTNMPQYYEKQALISQTLTTKKAFCQGYAEVFNEVCAKIGVPSYLVTGFVIPKGSSKPVSHAWCAALLNGKWYLFDPTWGAGFVENGKFVSRINTRYFMAPPAKMIQTHIPFDPLWQFSTQPLTYQEFISSRTGLAKPTVAKPKPLFSYRDSLAVYAASSHKAQLVSTIRRISAHKAIPPVVLDHLNHTKKNLAINNQNETVDLYNEAVSSFNVGIDQLNQFIGYRNNRFQPAKSEQELKQMTQHCADKFSETKRLLQQIKPGDNTNLFLSLQNMKAMVEKALLQVESQRMFVDHYFKTPVKQRPALFYKQALAERN
ncbi:transglutaminase domain-containing protein [Rufibacter tibetensis]|uniref:Transglutaminase-like domain-containing protein n=1 Tax=Rufibacter tibetensis TaxID=512763 RepID=A0A0P0C7I8_9BACT|nr:transglutaminase domain-containing protein [Rufibacter tibetensis]ALJ01039.1 hypothetical protein DC20_21150 [Rufibacter tibetensis]